MRCCSDNHLSVAMMKMKSLMPSWRTSRYIPSPCQEMLFPSCKRLNVPVLCFLCLLILILQLLTRDPTRRLGSGKADAEEIKRHPFFKDVSFDDVLNKRIPPPYFPTIVSLMFQVERNDVDFICRTGVRTPVTSMKSSQRSSRH
jgi:hypothetical protein